MKSFRNHLDPEKEEQLKTAKIAVENKVKKILKLEKGINGNKDGNSKKKSEIVHLIEDFHQHYESLYSLYEDLKREVKSNISGGDDTPSSSSSSSSDAYYSPEESVITNVPHGDDNQDSGTSNAEDTVLKVMEAAISTQGEVARLKLEIETLSSMNRHWEERADEAMQVREENSRLEGRVLELEGSCREREIQVKDLNVEKGELEERLSLSLVALQQELASANDQKSRLECELQKKSTETLEDEDGQTQISRLQTSLSESEKRVSTQQKKLKTCQNELESLRNERNTLHKEMEALKNDEKRHFSELLQSKSKMERRDNDLTEKIADQQETLLELGDAIRLLKAENEKLARTYRFPERKIDEMAQEIRKQLEDKRRIGRRHEQEKKELQESVESTTDDILFSLDLMALKLDEYSANFVNRISRASCELKFAREWARRKNVALVHVKHDMDALLSELDEKEAEIVAYKERARKSENKVRELERKMKKKEEGMLGVQEEKRVAIRELCVCIDYHRSRSDYYRKMLGEVNAGRRRKALDSAEKILYISS